MPASPTTLSPPSVETPLASGATPPTPAPVAASAASPPEGETQSFRELARLVGIAKPSVALLIFAALLAMLAAAGNLWFPVLAGEIVDEMGAAKLDYAKVALLAGVLVASSLIAALSSYLLLRVGLDVVANLRNALVEKMLRLPIARFDSGSSGESVSRVINDCKSISELVTQHAVGVLSSLFTLVGSVAVMLYLDTKLTLMLLGAIVGAFVVIVPVAMLLEKVSQGVQDRTARLSAILTNVFSEIRLVKAFTAEERERVRTGAEIEELRRLELRIARISIGLQPVIGLTMTAAILVILVYGAGRVGAGTMAAGTLTSFILYIFNVAGPLSQLTNFVAELQLALGASSRIGAILTHAAEEVRTGKSDRPAGGLLEFRGVSFAYQDGKPVLGGVDLAFRPGTTTALVGVSGSGKTTTLSLIERYYQPTGGEIVYDGEPIADWSLEAWRGSIGYVAQTAPVMAGTVRDNITYGLAGSFTDEQVREAARQAGALSFIESMPQGLDSVLIEQGNNVSGGQRQRLAIARMFLRDPDILILDEATSSLDSETEHEVRQALHAVMQGRTNIIVAHRLSTVMHTDRIYVLENGRITGVGTHQELIATHPFYARLVERQFDAPPITADEATA